MDNADVKRLNEQSQSGITASDFIKLEYESGITVIERLNNQKLSYQKLYIALITVIGSVSIALLKIQPQTESLGIKITHLIGFLQLLTALLGFGVIRNMAAARKNAVFWTKNLIAVRSLITKQLKLPSNYPIGHAPKACDRSSSDYITIITCSLVNILLLVSAVSFLFYIGGPLQLSVTASISVALYAFIHFRCIECFLKKEED